MTLRTWRVRILLAGAAETYGVEIAETELARVEVRMLAGQHKGWPAASRDQACATGAILIASGLVPMTSLISDERSTSP